MVEDALGAAGSLVSVVLWVPQARRTFAQRHDRDALAGLSLGTLALVMLNATLWLLYSATVGSYWPGLPGLVTFPLSMMMFWLAWRSRRFGRRASCGHGVPHPHRVVVTSPPGFRSSVLCDGTSRTDVIAASGAVGLDRGLQ